MGSPVRLGAASLVFIAAFSVVVAADSPGFTLLGTTIGIGGQEDALVGPGPAGSQRYYLDYTYANFTLDLTAIDPDTGAVQLFLNPAKSEWSPKGMTVGPDGNLYLGTAPNAHLLRLETATGKFTDLGRPSRTEQYIWQTTVGSDGKIYGCTYPSAKLVSYDPATGISADLDRMDPVELYARFIAASADGFVYIGIGYGTAHLVAYEIATGNHKDILPADYHVTGVVSVRQGVDGKAYSSINGQNFRLEGFNAIPLAPTQVPAAPARNAFSDGRRIALANNLIRVTDPATATTTTFPYTYGGEPLPIFRVGLGPDNMLYASTVLPFDLIQADPELGNPVNLGQLGGGEAYSFLASGDRLLIAAYGANAPLMSFDPQQPVGTNASGANPKLITYAGQDTGWRPQSMIAGPDGRIYIGAVAGYGKLNGPLTVWDPASNGVETYPLYQDQSIVSVAAVNSLIVGGTSISGGGGSHPTATEARLFVWNPAASQMVFETVPVPNAGMIGNLVGVPDGTVYGFAGSNAFVFDPQARNITSIGKLPFVPLASSVVLGPDGNLWGLASNGIFQMDLQTRVAKLVAPTPQPVTAGMAMDATKIYFGSGSTLYSYRWASSALLR